MVWTDGIKLADIVELDDAGHITIDGEEFPYWVDEMGPTVEPGGHAKLAVVNIPLLVNRAILLRSIGSDEGPITTTMPGDVSNGGGGMDDQGAPNQPRGLGHAGGGVLKPGGAGAHRGGQQRHVAPHNSSPPTTTLT